MKAMVLESIGTPLKLIERPDPIPGVGEIRSKVEACAICRTDLHVVDGDLPHPNLPVIPGHEIVGVIDSVGEGVASSRLGRRVGVPWLGHTCGHCPYCAAGSENLCDQPLFTGYTRDGGFASHVIADEHFAFDLDADADAVSLAPLLCAGLIGWRCLNKAGEGKLLAIYGFGAAAHIIAQIAIWQDRKVFAFTRPGDEDAQAFARSLGATWAGGSDEHPPKQLDAAIIFAPVGALVPNALRAVRKGGRVVCGGIHMSDIPAMPYRLLWEERELVSVANLTRHDAEEFFPVAKIAQVRTHTKVYSLEQANLALDDLRAGRLSGAAVLVP
ncbi:zinc-dependent alcohol dehydrogenase family protein [Mesorhizobium sp.]|uniref:zinc-dependent alcohol dehydrogenase family protein n=1 Tax=Mesorhizobium sp. TaxID=1871066 RepID=UPI000FE5FD79|nr:zinc-dependent alcohol dehydrogenase family protein [Mesorhizobium sp.]RWK65679.1 MAG: zinc-binding alcohol dehydrogenase family protein [Mesorhizobium sp.]RWM53899.1 MAG: zinc-binding alcohol dehydrogenase family protein [Mesorhizobium sp.]RWM60733.1 MAG: zinc-binding alcohol dehydrogenase family protein [Mesorhizobium sp.]RWM62073.1 MAG: zinc-binding alcohol dehydrogenase family protein [Mesorhizobium sp.]RWN03703.1 MAG: zinc-binding alcohol dehydrogenase family protein [Mesorhizobium sp.